MGFELGQQPVEAFIQKNYKELFPDGTPDEEIKAAKKGVKKLQRVYDITPSNEALKVCLEQGIDSSQDVVAYSKEDFLAGPGKAFSSIEEAKSVYDKAEQVSTVVYSFATAVREIDSTMPSIPAVSAPPEVKEQLKNELIKQFPTIERLFGSLDFCECEHCRSVLSPAAYFVDLLKFIEPDDNVWAGKDSGFLAKWTEKHPGESYMKDWDRDDKEKKPYHALIERRPDLPHLPLTCENTNTILPYIDLTNEILEYYVAHNGHLENYRGHDSRDLTTPELLAEPQNVVPEAYDELKNALYPISLPFDLWLETVRMFFEHFETPLWKVLYVFRRDKEDDEELFDLQPPPPRPPIESPTNDINATAVVPDSDALFFKERHYYALSYHDVSANTLHTETKIISSIGSAGSGGPGKTLITLSGVWMTPPVAGDLLVASHYSLAAIFKEYLGISPAEYDIFSSADPLEKWQELYGYTAAKLVIENPTNATDATVVVTDVDAAVFNVGEVVTYYDVSANAFHTDDETKTISSIGSAGSGGPGKTLITLSGVWITPPVAGDLLVFNAPTVLKSAKTLARRLGVTYKELVQIVQTAFVNPELDKLAILWKLHINIAEIVRYFINKETPDPKYDEADKKYIESVLSGSPLSELEKHWTDGTFKKALVLRDTSGLCNFDKTYLEFADLRLSSAAEKTEQQENFKLALLKINLFVRLWKKLGWRIEETDRALQVFIHQDNLPKVTDVNFGPAFGSAFQTALVYMAHLKALNEQAEVSGKDSRMKLLTLWSDLQTTGTKPLYEQLFLSKSALKNDPVFDDPMGRYLSYFDAASGQYKPFRWNAAEPEDKGTGNVSLKSHLLTLQGAMNLTADDIIDILADVHKELENEPLTLENVSLLYRYGLLAKALKHSVSDLITLKQLSGMDPFKLLEPSPITSLSQDYPFYQTLRFVEVAEKVKASGFTLEDLNFLLSHRFDPFGKYRFKSEAVLGMINTIATEIKRIQDEHIIIKTKDLIRQRLEPRLPAGVEPTDVLLDGLINIIREFAARSRFKDKDAQELRDNLGDPLLGVPTPDELFEVVKVLVKQLHSEYSAITDDMVKQKLSLVLPADVTDKFFGFWKDTIEFSAKKEEVDENAKLDPTIYEVNRIRVSYDGTREWQQVIHMGVLTNDKKSSILNKIPQPDVDAPQAQKDAYNNFIELIDKIAAESQSEPKAFLEKYFEGFLVYDDLSGSDSTAGLSEEEKEALDRHKIFGAIIPFVQQRLIRQFIVQTLSTNLNADPLLVEELLTDKALIAEPSNDDPNNNNSSKSSLLDLFAALVERGVSVKFFDNTGTQIGSTTATVETVDTSIEVDHIPIKPNAAKGARFDGYLLVPKSGAYRFFIILDKQNAEAEMTFFHLPDPFLTEKAPMDGYENSEFIELKQGISYRFSLNIKDLQNGDVSLLVKPEDLPKDRLSQQMTLYPQTVVEQVMRAYVLLVKTLQLIQNLKLSEHEVRYILTHRENFDDIDLSKLPTKENDNNNAAVSPVTLTLFKQFLRLADYASLKNDLSAESDDLIAVLENSHRTHMEITYVDEAKTSHFELLAKLTRRESMTVRSVAESLGFSIEATAMGDGAYNIHVQDIANVEKLWRLWEALQVVQKFGVPVDKIVSWATPSAGFSVAKDLRNTVNARYEPENWQPIAQSIFDKLRQRKRDSLVAYIMHKEGFERIEKLFEHFLIDPGMEPVVQTSRIRLAISSVQLFIQRCLLNLETRVSPSAIINSQHWQWMKRYRIWEANRKIFLFPENWLEPEFRDDKTHIFQELESALLQGDVSNDLAEDAFFNYLKKLEELAKLDIVTMYLEEKTDPNYNTLHVIGRTFNSSPTYFYRRYAQQMWTPWEPVAAEIGNSDHVVAVVWRERLHLFWLTFLDKAKEEGVADSAKTPEQKAGEPIQTKKEFEVQLNWSDYFQGQWTAREAAGFGKPILLVDLHLEKNEVFIYASLKEDGSLLINLGGEIEKAFRIRSKNAFPKLDDMDQPKDMPYSVTQEDSPTRYTGSDEFKVRFVQQIETTDYKVSSASAPVPEKIIQAMDDDEFFILPCMMPQTLLDTIFHDLKLLAGLFVDDVDDDAIRKRLFDFVYSIRLRLSNQSSSVANEISEEWNTIRDEIVKLDKGWPWLDDELESIDTYMYELEQLAADGRIADIAREEIKTYTNPFFYQDKAHCFFVEPTLFETTIVEYNDYAINNPLGKEALHLDELLDDIYLEANIPSKMPSPPHPSPFALFEYKTKKDWVTDSTTVVVFDDSLILQDGGLDSKILPFTNDDMRNSESLIKINPGSEHASGSAVAARAVFRLDSRERSLLSGGLNVVGGSGITSVLLRELNRKQGGGGRI